MEKDCKDYLPYLASGPIRGPVREIQISIWSHDQGFSDYREHHGTFDHSWTWFELGVEKPSGQKDIVEDRVAVNVHASDKFRCHQVLYRGTRSGWVHDLGIGDKISIIPEAKFSGWRNVVREASIEIHTSCL